MVTIIIVILQLIHVHKSQQEKVVRCLSYTEKETKKHVIYITKLKTYFTYSEISFSTLRFLLSILHSLLPQTFEEGISVLLRQKLSGPCTTEKLMFCTQYCVTKLTARVSNLPEKMK